MSSDRERMREIFDRVRRVPASERASVLDGLSEDERPMRGQIEDMLAALDEAGPFLSEPTCGELGLAAAETRAAPIREAAGTRIGPYKLLQLIGEGGFGSVFMAEQERPVRRKVALKIIKLGMDTKAVIARFEAERQALALMDHPNIAKVLDAGATDTGRPFFVMELVKGDPIAEYCDKHNLAIDERLALFAEVCHAVQHAHTKGIIHRDLKPSNILVSTQDGRPHAKVIDFGIAKATASRLTERTLFTEHRQLIGTPEYMSPEQAEGSLDIDTRTDVYSLGVLLYELLTGTTPFTGRELRSAAFAKIQRIIREVEPPKPSTRLSQSADTLASVAARRHTEPRKLGTIVRGDLDWIVMKALEKDRARRYETANGLAMDVRRYLDGEEVLAAPPSAAYRMRKFVRRHRGQVTAAALVAAALVAGLAGTAWQAKRASDEAYAARKAEDDAKAARNAANARADELKQVSDFQASMLAQVDPTTAGVRLTEDVRRRLETALESAQAPDSERAELSAAFGAAWSRVNPTDAAAALIDTTILRPAVKAIDEKFKSQPLVAAQLRQALADRYRDLGLFDAALPLQQDALDARRRLLGEEHLDTLQSMDGMSLLLQLKGKHADAEACVRDVIERRRRVQGEDARETIYSLDTLSQLLRARGKLDEACDTARLALERSRRVLGEDDPETTKYLNNLGSLLQDQGKLVDAERCFREALDKYRRVGGNDSVLALTVLNNIGSVLKAQRKFDEAESCFRDSLEGRRRVLGEEHPTTIVSIANVGSVLDAQGKYAEAEGHFREALTKARRVLGDDHPKTLMTQSLLSSALSAQQRFAEAEPHLRDVVVRMRRVQGDDDPATIATISRLGAVLLDQSKYAEAESLARESLDRSRRVFGDEHRITLTYAFNLSCALARAEKFADAETQFRATLEITRRVLGPDHPTSVMAANGLGSALERMGRFAEAVEVLASVEAATRALPGAGGTRNTRGLLLALGRARMGLGFDPDRFKAAEANLLEAHSLLDPTRPADADAAAPSVQGLVDLYTAWDTAAPGQGFDGKAKEWQAKLDVAKDSARK